MPRSRKKNTHVKPNSSSIVPRPRQNIIGRKSADDTIDLTGDSFTESPRGSMTKTPRMIEIIDLDETDEKEEGEITQLVESDDEVELIGVILSGEPVLKDSKNIQSSPIKPKPVAFQMAPAKPLDFAMPKIAEVESVKKNATGTIFPSFDFLKQQVDLLDEKIQGKKANINIFPKKNTLRCLINDNTTGIIKKRKNNNKNFSRKVQPQGRPNQRNKRYGHNPFYPANVSEQFKRIGSQKSPENVVYKPIKSMYQFSNAPSRFVNNNIPKQAPGPVFSSFGSYYVSSDGKKDDRTPGKNRPIYIDGSNVAIGHGNSNCFSSLGIKICVDYFKERGHEVIKAIVPQYRRKANESKDRHILEELDKKGNMIFTPSREVGGQRIVSYDDRYIIQIAAINGGIIVSNDNYRDLYNEEESFRDTIKNRILPFTWMSHSCIMFPPDPMGRHGPLLDEFLRF